MLNRGVCKVAGARSTPLDYLESQVAPTVSMKRESTPELRAGFPGAFT